MSVSELTDKFSGYAKSGLDGIARNDNERRCAAKMVLRGLLRNSFRTCRLSYTLLIILTLSADEALGDSHAKLSYKNYELDVVRKHCIHMVGWPAPHLNLNALSLRQLEDAISAIEGGLCVWEELTQEELAARIAEQEASGTAPAYKKRKSRSDQGEKRPRKKIRSLRLSPSNDNHDDHNSGDDEDDDDAQHKSATIIDSDLDD